MNKDYFEAGKTFIELRNGDVMFLVVWKGQETFIDRASNRLFLSDLEEDLTYSGSHYLDIMKMGVVGSQTSVDFFKNVRWEWKRKDLEMSPEERSFLEVFSDHYTLIGRTTSGDIFLSTMGEKEGRRLEMFNDYFNFIKTGEIFAIEELLEEWDYE